MKKILLAMLIAAAGAVSSAQAQTPGCTNCGSQGVSYPAGHSSHFSHAGSHFGTAHPASTHPLFGHPLFSRSGNISRQPTLPVYMAAPWYLYWPYHGHFQTVAPMAAGQNWSAPPQSAWGGNQALPTFPGYTPYVPNQVYPGYQQGAWPATGTTPAAIAPAQQIPANIPAPQAPARLPANY